jgi:hypothetical protein
MPEAPVDYVPVVSLEAVELTILTCWAEAVAEALAASSDQLNTVLDDARAGAPWRRQLGVAEPSADLASALEDLSRMVLSGTPTVQGVLAAMDERPRGGDYGHLVRTVLRSKLGLAWCSLVSAAVGPQSRDHFGCASSQRIRAGRPPSGGSGRSAAAQPPPLVIVEITTWCAIAGIDLRQSCRHDWGRTIMHGCLRQHGPGVDRSTITRAVHEVRPLLAARRTPSRPPQSATAPAGRCGPGGAAGPDA